MHTCLKSNELGFWKHPSIVEKKIGSASCPNLHPKTAKMVAPRERLTQAVSFVAGHSWLDQPAQMDDLHCFVRGFHTKHVADVQKLAEIGDVFVICAQCSVRCAEIFSVIKNPIRLRILP
jgi:hypothetical protein